MAGEWRRHEVSRLLDAGSLVIGDGYRAKNEELANSGLPFARAGNINDGFQFHDADHFPEANLARVGNKVSKPGDVVFTSKGTVGRFAFVRNETPRFVYSPQLCFWRSLDPSLIEPRFLFYWMFGREFFVQFKGVAGQTDMAEYVSLRDQRRMHITLPPVPDQRAIAHILGTLDDKIELNRRMNETLEAMARALFKSWFVDFDPVRAKAEGRDPGLPKPLADLFPARLVDSELGEIPEGWHVERLSDVMTFQGGAQPPASQFISEERESYVRLVQIRDFYSSDHITFVPDSPKLRKFETDDIMIARYGSSGNAEKSNDSLARICRGLSGAYNVALVKVVPKRPCREFLGQFLRSAPFQSVIKGMGARSVQSGFRKEDLDIIDVVVAPEPVHVAFERFANAVWERTKATGDQSRKLAALRDALLPKLISGELRVNGAERLVVEGL